MSPHISDPEWSDLPKWEAAKRKAVAAEQARHERATLPHGETRQRQAILDTLDARCGTFEYFDENRCGYRKPGCPICHDPLRVTFRGQLVDLECVSGCAERDVVAALFRRAAA